MRVIGQILSVFAIAVGVGLLVAGATANPLGGAESVHQAVPAFELSGSHARFYHDIAISLKGTGAGLLVLGVLALVVPWVNALVYDWLKRSENEMSSKPDSSRP